jgi:ATPase subunit of ABC transporter with duplicated ATPase domains
VKAYEVQPRARHQRSQPQHELQRAHDQVLGAVAPRGLGILSYSQSVNPNSRLPVHARMAGPAIAVLRGVMLTLGAAPLFTGVDLALARGERMPLVGRNGRGQIDADAHSRRGDGTRRRRDLHAVGVVARHLLQEPDFSGFATALDYVSDELDPDMFYRAESELGSWGVPFYLDLTKASGRQSRRIALAHAFAHDPDILLLGAKADPGTPSEIALRHDLRPAS